MDDKLRRQLEEIINKTEVAERDATFLRQALAIDPAVEDGPWIKSIFQLAAIFLELFYGNKEEANRALPWLLFSLGMAYERYYAQKKGYNGGG